MWGEVTVVRVTYRLVMSSMPGKSAVSCTVHQGTPCIRHLIAHLLHLGVSLEAAYPQGQLKFHSIAHLPLTLDATVGTGFHLRPRYTIDMTVAPRAQAGIRNIREKGDDGQPPSPSSSTVPSQGYWVS